MLKYPPLVSLLPEISEDWTRWCRRRKFQYFGTVLYRFCLRKLDFSTVKSQNFRLRRLGTMIIGIDDILARRRRRKIGSIESGKKHSFVKIPPLVSLLQKTRGGILTRDSPDVAQCFSSPGLDLHPKN